jgi:hypothetical protein
MPHDVSWSAGDCRSQSGCAISRPVAQRGQTNTSKPVRVDGHEDPVKPDAISCPA